MAEGRTTYTSDGRLALFVEFQRSHAMNYGPGKYLLCAVALAAISYGAGRLGPAWAVLVPALGATAAGLAWAAAENKRRQVEAKLRERGDHFCALVEEAADVCLLLDADGIVRYVSPSIPRLLGHTPAE